jgi:hypothetical protein
MSRMDWRAARMRDTIRDRGAEPARDDRDASERGISNAQAKALAALQREAGEVYTGSGMTAREAAAAIERLKGRRP